MTAMTAMTKPTFKRWVRRVWRAPSVHFALLGAVLFLGSSFFTEPEAAGRPRVQVAAARVSAARVSAAERTFAAEEGRPPTAAEKTALLDRLANEEVLFQYALSLDLHHAEVPLRRLASIAAFVEPTGNDAPAQAVLARRAVELGLHQDDFVTRRVLIDAAARLIRAAARLVEPSEEELERFLEQHGEHFRGEGTIRISHLLLSSARRAHPRADADALLDRLRRKKVSPENAASLGDQGPVPPHLPLLSERSLERRFARDFTESLVALREGEWSGPVVSRHGVHLVFVHERRPGRVPELTEARAKVLALWHEAAAELWLAERLRQLREEYAVVIEGEATS